MEENILLIKTWYDQRTSVLTRQRESFVILSANQKALLVTTKRCVYEKTMKSNNGIISVSLILIIGLVGIIGITHLRKTSRTFNFIFTPSNFSTPLASADIDFGAKGKTYILNFKNIYPGLHWIEVTVEKPISVSEKYKGDFELLLEINAGDNQIITKAINGPGSSFAGYKEGFEIFWYRSPDDLPLREPLVAKVTIVKPDTLFASKYGKAVLAIRKLSDE